MRLENAIVEPMVKVKKYGRFLSTVCVSKLMHVLGRKLIIKIDQMTKNQQLNSKKTKAFRIGFLSPCIFASN